MAAIPKGKCLEHGGDYETELQKIASERGLVVIFYYYNASVCITVKRDGDVVGVLTIMEDQDLMFRDGASEHKQLYLGSIKVEPAYRGDKIGTMLMAMAYRLALSRESGLRYYWTPAEREESPAAFHAKVLERFKLGPPTVYNTAHVPFERISENADFICIK